MGLEDAMQLKNAFSWMCVQKKTWKMIGMYIACVHLTHDPQTTHTMRHLIKA